MSLCFMNKVTFTELDLLFLFAGNLQCIENSCCSHVNETSRRRNLPDVYKTIMPRRLPEFLLRPNLDVWKTSNNIYLIDRCTLRLPEFHIRPKLGVWKTLNVNV